MKAGVFLYGYIILQNVNYNIVPVYKVDCYNYQKKTDFVIM